MGPEVKLCLRGSKLDSAEEFHWTETLGGVSWLNGSAILQKSQITL